MFLLPSNIIQGHEWSSIAYGACISFLVLIGLRIAGRPSLPKDAPRLVKENLPILGSLRFFKKRWAFCKDAASATETGNYSFYCGNYPVVGVSGLKGRKAFYESKDFSLADGYAALLTATPDVNSTENGIKFDAWFAKKLIKHFKKENLARSLPFLLSDTLSALEWISLSGGTGGGMFDPFEEMNRIVYRLTMRSIGVREISESPELLEESLHLVEAIDKNSSTARIIFPWLPTLKHGKRLVASVRFYLMIHRIVQKRKKTGRREDDMVQVLLDEGESTMKIVMFLINGLLAALLNSGINAAWVLCYLALNPQWKERVRAEVDAAILKRSTTSPSQTPVDILSKLTLDEWESEFPVINMCLQESIRLQTVGAAFRKNVGGKDVKIGGTGEVVPKDGFVAFPVDDVHMNPEIYPDPIKFDPGRYTPKRAEDKKVPLAFVGWGSGRHACLGMRFAKLENAIITASFMAMFDYILCDAQEKPVTETPLIDRELKVVERPKMPLRLKYTPRG